MQDGYGNGIDMGIGIDIGIDLIYIIDNCPKKI
jgi:hypothetical protein